MIFALLLLCSQKRTGECMIGVQAQTRIGPRKSVLLYTFNIKGKVYQTLVASFEGQSGRQHLDFFLSLQRKTPTEAVARRTPVPGIWLLGTYSSFSRVNSRLIAFEEQSNTGNIWTWRDRHKHILHLARRFSPRILMIFIKLSISCVESYNRRTVCLTWDGCLVTQSEFPRPKSCLRPEVTGHVQSLRIFRTSKPSCWRNPWATGLNMEVRVHVLCQLNVMKITNWKCSTYPSRLIRRS